MYVGKNELVGVRKALQTRPLSGRHLADIFLVDFALDVCDRFHRMLAAIDDKVSLASHAATDNRRGDSVQVFDLIAETVPERLVVRSVAS